MKGRLCENKVDGAMEFYDNVTVILIYHVSHDYCEEQSCGQRQVINIFSNKLSMSSWLPAHERDTRIEVIV